MSLSLLSLNGGCPSLVDAAAPPIEEQYDRANSSGRNSLQLCIDI
jgi:hypothetical protein